MVKKVGSNWLGAYTEINTISQPAIIDFMYEMRPSSVPDLSRMVMDRERFKTINEPCALESVEADAVT